MITKLRIVGDSCAFLVCTLTLLFVGCKSSGAKDLPPTQSGLPEVTLAARPAKEIQAVAREFFVGRGYAETPSKHVYEVVFDKPIKGDRSRRALRVRLRLFHQPDGSWRMVGRPMGVDSWRGDLESEEDVPNGKSQIQGFLDEIKTRIESNR
jgi:hypothetical protein